MAHFHAVLWIDHREAKIFGLGDEVSYRRIQNADAGEPVRRKAGVIGSGHLHAGGSYLKEVTDALGVSQEILVTGPAETKTELMSWMREHAPETKAKILGIETLDHPTHEEIVAFARRYFRARDRMTPQLP
jgi:stalled ribosome rescue protein Dom34